MPLVTRTGAILETVVTDEVSLLVPAHEDPMWISFCDRHPAALSGTKQNGSTG